MFDVKLPFTLAYNNEQLFEDIRNFDENQYVQKLDEFHSAVGLVFEGNATAKLCNIIEEKMK